jgi:DNA (cytosine-5)-methyltransferase 3A
VRAIKEAKPKYFIYENNKSMAKAIYDSISATFGFEPIMINSALVSAQNRERYYWVGKCNAYGDYDKVQIEQPKDRGIMLKDILITGEDLTGNDKAYYVTARISGAQAQNTIERSQRNMVAEPFRIMNYDLESVNDTDSGVQAMLDMPGSNDILRRVHGRNGKCRNVTTGSGGNHEPKVFEKLKVREATKQGYTEINVGECVDLEQPNSKTRRGRKMQDKSNALTTQNEFYQYIGKTYEVKDGQIEVKGKKYPIKLSDGLYVVRKLSVDECKRLQTVPDWYDMTCISNSQAYKCLGNGWTIEVTAHLIRATQEGKTEAKQLTFWKV